MIMNKPLLYLLVCEGPSDIPVIRRVAEEICRKTKKDVEIRHISPQQDSTGTWERHGYVGVTKWCALYGNKDEGSLSHLSEALKKVVLRKNWQALVKGANADGLIIQMDTDIADQLNFLKKRFDENKDDRRKYCQDSLLNKLGLINVPENLIFLLPSYSTETWIVASFDDTHDIFKNLSKPIAYEDLKNCETLLIGAGFKKERKGPGKYKLKKSHDIYIPYAELIASKLDLVTSRCKELKLFETELTKA